jgi:uncharacterized membrane protein
MATAPSFFGRSSGAKGKYFVLGFFGLMLTYVLQHNERFLVIHTDPFWEHIAPFKGLLLVHGLAAGCALLLGPLQFSERLRQRYAKFHRVVGRIYVGGVFIGAPMGVYVQHFEEHLGGTRTFTVATVVDASLWMLTTGVALAFILNGKVQQHRQWMVRSFTLATIFLQVRMISGIFGWDTADIHVQEAIVWGCIACAIPIADMFLQCDELLRERSIKAAKARAAAAKAQVATV